MRAFIEVDVTEEQIGCWLNCSTNTDGVITGRLNKRGDNFFIEDEIVTHILKPLDLTAHNKQIASDAFEAVQNKYLEEFGIDGRLDNCSQEVKDNFYFLTGFVSSAIEQHINSIK